MVGITSDLATIDNLWYHGAGHPHAFTFSLLGTYAPAPEEPKPPAKVIHQKLYFGSMFGYRGPWHVAHADEKMLERPRHMVEDLFARPEINTAAAM